MNWQQKEEAPGNIKELLQSDGMDAGQSKTTLMSMLRPDTEKV